MKKHFIGLAVLFITILSMVSCQDCARIQSFLLVVETSDGQTGYSITCPSRVDHNKVRTTENVQSSNSPFWDEVTCMVVGNGLKPYIKEFEIYLKRISGNGTCNLYVLDGHRPEEGSPFEDLKREPGLLTEEEMEWIRAHAIHKCTLELGQNEAILEVPFEK